MKKIIITFLILFLLPACSTNQQPPLQKAEENLNININTKKHINPIKIGLYEDNQLVKSYQTTKANHKDIAVFNIYYTNTETLENNFIKYNWNKYYNEYEFIDNYKIGFYISFDAEDKHIEQLILDPTTKHSMDPYLYIYLYDDIHQADGTWYSHLEPADMKEDTIFSSIKLYFAAEGSKISSPITLTVFSYDEDEIDEHGNYQGTNKYTITIEVK